MARVDYGQLTFTKICFYSYNSFFDFLLKWNLIQHFQELEFTGVMRFYYQAQDMDSGQKVGLVLFFQIKLKLFYHCNPQIPSSLLWDSVVTWPIDSENLLKHSSGHHPLQKVMYTRALQTLALEINSKM